jgi:hypothetical protein
MQTIRTNTTTTTTVPATPGEAAALAANWERRGALGRLVRLDAPGPVAEPRAEADRREAA